MWALAHCVPPCGAELESCSVVQVDAEVKRLAAENEVLLRQVRDLDNKATLAARDLSHSGDSAVTVRL